MRINGVKSREKKTGDIPRADLLNAIVELSGDDGDEFTARQLSELAGGERVYQSHARGGSLTRGYSENLAISDLRTLEAEGLVEKTEKRKYRITDKFYSGEDSVDINVEEAIRDQVFG